MFLLNPLPALPILNIGFTSNYVFLFFKKPFQAKKNKLTNHLDESQIDKSVHFPYIPLLKNKVFNFKAEFTFENGYNLIERKHLSFTKTMFLSN